MRAADTGRWRFGIRALAAAASVVLICAAMPASAAGAGDAAPPSRRVSYAGLDLNKPEDLAIFNRRVTAAAEQVCRPESESIALRLRRLGERCIADAIARASPFGR